MVVVFGLYDFLFMMLMLLNFLECLCILLWSVYVFNRVRIMLRIMMLLKIEGIMIKVVGMLLIVIVFIVLFVVVVV